MKVCKVVICACFMGLLTGCVTLSTERQINYGLNHYQMGLYSQAIPPLITAADSLEKETPPDPRLVEVLIALGEMAKSNKRKDLAADFFPRALKAAEALKPQDSVRLRNSLVHLGGFYLADRPVEAIPLYERAEVISRTFDDQVLHAIDLDNLALAYHGTKDFVHASSLSLKALDTLSSVSAGKLLTRTRGVALHNLAYIYMDMARYDDAETRFKESLTALRSTPAEVEPWRIKAVIMSYSSLLRRTGRAQEAINLEKTIEANGAPRR
jgi:tetratricopeptide (TPR) repeat protein